MGMNSLLIVRLLHKLNQTGCPAHAKAMPPQVADTITTTKSDINLKKRNLRALQITAQRLKGIFE